MEPGVGLRAGAPAAPPSPPGARARPSSGPGSEARPVSAQGSGMSTALPPSPDNRGSAQRTWIGRHQDPRLDPNGPLRGPCGLFFEPSAGTGPSDRSGTSAESPWADGQPTDESTIQTIRPPAFTGDSGLDRREAPEKRAEHES